MSLGRCCIDVVLCMQDQNLWVLDVLNPDGTMNLNHLRNDFKVSPSCRDFGSCMLQSFESEIVNWWWCLDFCEGVVLMFKGEIPPRAALRSQKSKVKGQVWNQPFVGIQQLDGGSFIYGTKTQWIRAFSPLRGETVTRFVCKRRVVIDTVRLSSACPLGPRQCGIVCVFVCVLCSVGR